jgi:hypothetical protein
VQVTRLLRGFPELAAQPGDVDIDGLVGAAVGHAPDVSEQVTPGDHLAGMECQVVQQVELAPAQIQWRTVQGGLVPVRVQPQAADSRSSPSCGPP